MLIGVPSEIKNHEYRVGLTPEAVVELRKAGHQVLIQSGAGKAIGLEDEAYLAAGANIVETAEELFHRARLIVKVKEPQPEECKLFREDQILFSFLHLAAEPELTNALLESGVTSVAYETVTERDGTLPLLAPMSAIAGRLAPQKGAFCLEKQHGGKGILLSGMPGVPAANVCIIGGGVVGSNAARIAVGMGANVTVLDTAMPRLQQLEQQYGTTLKTLFSTQQAIEQQLQSADLVIGAVLIPGAAAPKLISREMLSLLKPGAVLVDVAIDQGGCFATSKPTSHEHPTYLVDGITHYCVTNLPSAVARTATFALIQATLPYVLKIAAHGEEIFKTDLPLLKGMNTQKGVLTCDSVVNL